MHALRLTHPGLDFWVDVRVREFDGRWLAVADLAGTPDVGVGMNPREALREALGSLSATVAGEMAAAAERIMRQPQHWHRRGEGQDG